MASLGFLAFLVLMAREEFLAFMGRRARWVGRGFLVTLVRGDLLALMGTQVNWDLLAHMESLVLLETWALLALWAYQDLQGSRVYLETRGNQD